MNIQFNNWQQIDLNAFASTELVLVLWKDKLMLIYQLVGDFMKHMSVEFSQKNSRKKQFVYLKNET